MKAIFAILALFSFISVHASTQFSVQCTNAEGTVKWVESTHSNFIQFTNPETLTLDLKMVEIKFLDKFDIDHTVTNICGFYRSAEIYSGKVEIHPATSSVNVNVVETSVICRKEIKVDFVCRN